MPSTRPNRYRHGMLVLFILLLAGPGRAGDFPVVELERLPKRLQRILDDPVLQDARLSALVVEADSGRLVFARRPDSLANPASVSKIFTTAAALCLLHPDYRFRTALFTTGELTDGRLRAPLYLKGYADPFLVDERLLLLALKLRARGLQELAAPLVVDDSFFDDERRGPGWEQEHGSDAYLAPVGALGIDFNSIQVLVFPGPRNGTPARVEFLPHSGYLLPAVRVVTSPRRTRISIDVEPAGRRDRVRIRGRIARRSPGWWERCLVTRPARNAGQVLCWALHQAGISGRCRVRRGLVPARAHLLLDTWSPPLSELIRNVNKYSQNFMAEILFKTLGAELLAPPGTWSKGQQVMEAFLQEQLGIPPGSYVLHNGSGLNDVNRVSARQVVALLRHMWARFDVRADFVSSLAVAGADGSVDRRFEHPALSRTLRVKTGSLHNVRALAGYAAGRTGQVYAFAILVNNYSCRGSRVTRVIDRFASALASSDADLRIMRTLDVDPAPPEPGNGRQESASR